MYRSTLVVRLRLRVFLAPILVSLFIGVYGLTALACTSILVTPGASADGASSITQTADSGTSAYEILKVPARDWAPGTMTDILNLPQFTGGKQVDEVAGKPTGNSIPQISHTHAYIKGLFGMINEKQVAIGESTFGGRLDFRNANGWFEITNLSMLAMERAATAREAVEVMGRLAAEYGYKDAGEELSVADPHECWVFEIVGPGPLWEQGSDEPGAFWVAQRVPDGHVAASANAPVIKHIKWDDHDNFMYSRGILEYAAKRGWYDPDGGAEFNWRKDFCAGENPAICGRRVRRVMSLAAPSLAESLDEQDLPFSVPVPADRKLTLAAIAAVNRDHYDATEFYGGDSLAAGPWGDPRRYPSLTFKADGRSYSWQRTIAQVQCEYSIITQSRAWLPDPIGAVLWYGAANPDATCYVPFYAGVSSISESMNTKAGSHLKFTRDSYWWAISAVSTYIDLKWSYMIKDVRAAQDTHEGRAQSEQSAIDAAAAELYRRDPALAVEFLTDYCNANVEKVRDAWWTLLDTLIWKYNAGFVVEDGKIKTPGYPEEWLRRVIQLGEPDHFKK